MSWKKRGKKGWLGKKTAKELSEPKERTFAKNQIKQALQEELEGEEYRYKHKTKSKSEKQKILGRIKSIKQSIEYYQRPNIKNTCWNEYFVNDHLNWLKSWLKEQEDKLKKLEVKGVKKL